jgi:antitoxin component YwqK of YwqJK toxin-antitoxin module
VITKLYRRDGSKAIYERQVNGKDDGDYFIYYPDGSVKLKAENVNGIRVQEKVYVPDGKILSKSKCSNTGENCIVKFFDSKGNIKKEKSFKYKGIKYKTEW